MHSWYAKCAPKLGLAAENGFFYRWPDGEEVDEN
jgi:trehalose-6-phosphatase